MKFEGGTVSIGHNIAAANIQFNNAASATYTANRSLNGAIAINNTATLNFDTYTVTGNNTFTTASGTTLKSSLISAAANDNGHLTTTGTATINAGTKVYVYVPTSLSLTSGTQFKIVDAAAGGSIGTLTASNITTNSTAFKFTQVTSTEDLIVQAVANAVFGTTTPITGTGKGAADILDALAPTATGDMATAIAALQALSGGTLQREAARLAPLVNTANPASIMAAARVVLNAIGARLGNLRSVGGGLNLAAADSGPITGMAAGNETPRHGLWLKGFGANNDQNARDGFDGYKAKTAGLAFGLDRELDNGWTIGAALSHASTSVGIRDTRAGDSTGIRSVQLTGYASRELGEGYLDAMVSYAKHRNRASRQTALSRVATGNFDTDQLAAQIGGGWRIPLAAKLTLTPNASLQWSEMRQSAYTETGAGALSLAYQANKSTRWQSGIGAKLTHEGDTAHGAVRTDVHATWLHDFKDAAVDTTAAYTGGGASFMTPGQKLKKDGLALGVGLTWQAGQNAKVSLGYDAEKRPGFLGQSVQVTGRWAF